VIIKRIFQPIVPTNGVKEEIPTPMSRPIVMYIFLAYDTDTAVGGKYIKNSSHPSLTKGTIPKAAKAKAIDIRLRRDAVE
jgi:hypothetical protein